MCLPFLCSGVDDTDDGTPASRPAHKPPASEQRPSPAHKPPASEQRPSPAHKPPASEQLPSPAMNGLPSSGTNGVSKPPGAAGGHKSSPQEPEKFDTARKEGDKKSENVQQGAKAYPDYAISSATTDYKPSSTTGNLNKKDDSAKKGGQDADAGSRINQDQRLPSVGGVAPQANRGRINQDQEKRASTNEPGREAAHADNFAPLANPTPRKDQPRRGEHIY